MSAKRKQSAVLRLLRGEDLDLVSRELGVTAAELGGIAPGLIAQSHAFWLAWRRGSRRRLVSLFSSPRLSSRTVYDHASRRRLLPPFSSSASAETTATIAAK